MRLYVASAAQIQRTEDWESRQRYWYKDLVGVWTGGAGHTEPSAAVRASFQEPFADAIINAWLSGDLETVERALSLLMATEPRLLPQNAADAAIDAGFNCGTKILTPESSGFARAILALDLVKASTEILRWCMVVQDGKKVPNQGLLNRRKAESALILSPDAPHPDTSDYVTVYGGAVCNPDELEELEHEQLETFIQASLDTDYSERDWQHDGSDPLNPRRASDTEPAPPLFDPDKTSPATPIAKSDPPRRA